MGHKTGTIARKLVLFPSGLLLPLDGAFENLSLSQGPGTIFYSSYSVNTCTTRNYELGTLETQLHNTGIVSALWHAQAVKRQEVSEAEA